MCIKLNNNIDSTDYNNTYINNRKTLIKSYVGARNVAKTFDHYKNVKGTIEFFFNKITVNKQNKKKEDNNLKQIPEKGTIPYYFPKLEQFPQIPKIVNKNISASTLNKHSLFRSQTNQ